MPIIVNPKIEFISIFFVTSSCSDLHLHPGAVLYVLTFIVLAVEEVDFFAHRRCRPWSFNSGPYASLLRCFLCFHVLIRSSDRRRLLCILI